MFPCKRITNGEVPNVRIDLCNHRAVLRVVCRYLRIPQADATFGRKSAGGKPQSSQRMRCGEGATLRTILSACDQPYAPRPRGLYPLRFHHAVPVRGRRRATLALVFVDIHGPALERAHIVNMRLPVVPREREEQAVRAECRAVDLALEPGVASGVLFKDDSSRCSPVAAADVVQTQNGRVPFALR